MGLRDYQQEALAAIQQAEREGCTKQLVLLPTGTGKTVIASHLPAAIGLKPWESMGFIVAQEELAFQAVESLQSANPDLRVALEKAEHHGEADADIIVASIDTLARSPGRLEKYSATMFRAIFLDECHGAVAPRYQKVLQYLRVLKGDPDCDPGRLLIGLTATARRFDGISLGTLFDKIVYRRTIREMIAANWIADPVGYRVDTGVGLDDIAFRQGDFAVGELSHKMNTPENNALVVKKYLELGEGLPFIVFTVDIEHSDSIAATFREHAISCQAISSNTPKGQRKELVQAHRDMRVLGLASCQALLTGFDSPPATVALFARPTCSGLLYTQAVGRVLRSYPAPENAEGHTGYVKTRAIIIDFAGNSTRHRLFTASTLFGLSPQFDMKGRSITKTLSELEKLQRQNPTLDIQAFAGLEDVQAASQDIDLWRPAPIPKLARANSQFLWMQVGDDVYRLSAPGAAIFLEVNHLGQYEVNARGNGAPNDKLIFDEPEDAFGYADSLVPDESVGLLKSKARWRGQPPTEKQSVLLWRLDPVVRQRFQSGETFYRYANRGFAMGNHGFSRGGISLRIEQCKRAKEWSAGQTRREAQHG